MSGGDSRTEKPTPRRLKEARREGRIARTQDFGAWAGVLVASVVIPITIRHTADAARALLFAANELIVDPQPQVAVGLLGKGLQAVLIASAPLALAILVVGVASAAGQGGLHFATKQVKPQFKKLNPLPGVKRMFGVQGAWEAAKTILKSAVLGLVLWRSVQQTMPLLVGAGALPLGAVVEVVSDAMIRLMQVAAGTGLALAAADYFVVKRRTDKSLKMSQHEIKQELKQSEGDAHVKGARRARQLAMSRNRMMSDVPKADVVLVNPTHVAVALRYDPAKGAPRVVAKGAGTIAARIRELADEHRVPMVEDVPLARALHKACEIGQEIPPDLYAAVARVLAFVLNLRSRGSAAGLHRAPTLAGAA